MLLKLAGKRYNYEFLLVNFLDTDGGEQTLFEEAIEDIDVLCLKEFKIAFLAIAVIYVITLAIVTVVRGGKDLKAAAGRCYWI